MATRFELVLVGDDGACLRPAAEAALAEIEEVARRLTRFERSSFTCFLEREAHRRPVRLDADLFELFELCLAVEAASGGAFRITHGSPGGFLLDEQAGTVQLSEPYTKLDFGAVAKGFAIDLAVAELRAAPEVRAALLHGGTSTSFAFGQPPLFDDGATDGWPLAVNSSGVQLRVALDGRALSASAQQRSQGPQRDGPHLVDPRPGTHTAADASAAVTAPRAALADAWSTALAVLGPQASADLEQTLRTADVEWLSAPAVALTDAGSPAAPEPLASLR